ncbi:MAG TPA: SH3 domain-containing protein [Pyrinomonadaceae bacterium]
MLPGIDSDSRAEANGSRRLFSLAACLIFFLAAHCAAAVRAADPSAAQEAARPALITTAAGARLRERPDAGAAEVGRLQLGQVVDELERSAGRSRVGSAEDYWHLVSARGGARGWVFGGLVAPYDPARRDETYLGLARERLANPAATFAELSELVRFLDRAVKEVTRRPALAELELARLSALARSLASFNIEGQEKEPYKSWTTQRETEIVYSEPAGQWYVRAGLFWDLERKYRGLPLAERAAWEAAQTPLPGECEGYLPCYVYLETETNGRYLKLYPRGAHASESLAKLAESLGQIATDLRGPNPVYEVPRADRASFRRSLASLRAQLAPVPAAKKARALGLLEEIARRFR